MLSIIPIFAVHPLLVYLRLLLGDKEAGHLYARPVASFMLRSVPLDRCIDANVLADSKHGAPETALPEIGKKVRLEEYASFKLRDRFGQLFPGLGEHPLMFNPNQPVKAQLNWKDLVIDWAKVAAGDQNILDEMPDFWKGLKTKINRWHDQDKGFPRTDREVGKLQSSRYDLWSHTDGANDDPDVEWLHDDKPDVDKPDMDGKKPGGIGKKVKIPQGIKLSEASKLYRFAAAKTAAATGPFAPFLAILSIGMEEAFFMSQAHGNADIYWDCFKDRLNPFRVDHCSAVDADGNIIDDPPDLGPFGNFKKNMLDMFVDKDIDGDGEEENIWERFIDSMEDTGHMVRKLVESTSYYVSSIVCFDRSISRQSHLRSGFSKMRRCVEVAPTAERHSRPPKSSYYTLPNFCRPKSSLLMARMVRVSSRIRKT